MTKLRDQLIRIQKKNYCKNVNLIRESSGYNPGIKIYEKEYLHYLKAYEEISNKTELIQKVLTADLIYHGDYHTLKQSQHSVLRILREIEDKRDIILCLEMFHGRDQKHIDQFMAGELSEKIFLERIDYAKKWPFHWGNWSPIISFCRGSEKLEESDVLKIDGNKYCVMNTMPANKIQSYVNWLEYSRDAYFPVHQDWEDDAFEDRGQMVHEMVTTLAKILDLDFPLDALDKLTIYYPSNLDFMEFVHSTPEFKGRLQLIRSKIKKEEGFLLEYEVAGENAYLIYLANSNINMAAEEATHFLNVVLRGPLKKAVSAFDGFYRNVITECLGFFGSKFINEKRKSHSENSIRMFLGQEKRGELKHTGQEILQVGSAVTRMFSTQLGYILGNKLYYALKNGKFSLRKVQSYFRDSFDEPTEAFNCYLEISNRVKKVKQGSRF